MRKLWPRLLPNGDPAGILPDFCTRSLYAPARTGSTLAWTVHCASSLRCRGLVPPLEPRWAHGAAPERARAPRI